MAVWDIKQAVDRLGKAVGIWKAPGTPLEERLKSALLSATDFPERAIPAEFHSRYRELYAAATSAPDSGHGSIQATVDQMDEQTASDLMKGFEALYHDLCGYMMRHG